MEMKDRRLYYNMRKNQKIKALALWLVAVSINVFGVYLYYSYVGEDINAFMAVLISLLIIGLVYLLSLLSFGEVIDNNTSEQILTFYEFGTLKFRVRILGQLESISMSQDTERYFCLKVTTTNGESFIVERYPTLNEASNRLEEFQATLG